MRQIALQGLHVLVATQFGDNELRELFIETGRREHL